MKMNKTANALLFALFLFMDDDCCTGWCINMSVTRVIVKTDQHMEPFLLRIAVYWLLFTLPSGDDLSGLTSNGPTCKAEKLLFTHSVLFSSLAFSITPLWCVNRFHTCDYCTMYHVIRSYKPMLKQIVVLAWETAVFIDPHKKCILILNSCGITAVQLVIA